MMARKNKDMQQQEVPGSPNKPGEHSFSIVGIGASAGGLAAFEAFFSGMPAEVDPGMAFVLVQHLAPDHRSILTELVQRYTRMQVFEVEDGMVVKPNCVYIIPPNCDMALLNGTLQLLDPSLPRGQRMPIDFFFRSLAHDQHEKALGIVLSGTGSDGTFGVRFIKGAGGMVMVQSPESAEFDGMPASAIATGLVDYQLPPAEMPARLTAYAARTTSNAFPAQATLTPKEEAALKKILILLRNQTSHDFSQYKPNTIQRRTERRMVVNQITTIERYLAYLQQTPEEMEALFNELLIGVTSFFRDPEAFKALEDQVIPKLFAGKSADAVIRVWVPGCSTGEEAYSIAILLAERQEAMKQSFKVQVFATDIDSRAINTARSGVYPASIASDVSPERLRRFFVATTNGDGSYRIHKGIRDILVFSEHNLIKDPPFSKLDLISCRNLLIYLDNDLQKRIIPMFHYALNPKGYLFQGTSETVAEYQTLFDALDRGLKLYQRKDDLCSTQRSAPSRFIPPLPAVSVSHLSQNPSKITFPVQLPLRQLTEQALLQRAPAAVLVNNQGDALYVHGSTGMYLETARGEVGVSNILIMAREGLRHELTTALHKSVVGKEIVHYSGLRVKTNGGFSRVNLTVQPIATGPVAAPEAPLYLVILEMAPIQPAETKDHESLADVDSVANKLNARLRSELSAKDAYIQAIREQLEASNEELKSSNEEMQSVNEELQSTNEELETSREELQSVNEEINSVNNELQVNMANLSKANDDMSNMLGGTGIGTIFVDHRLRILRFTPTATRMINLIASDVGRPIGHTVTNLVGYDSLVADAQAVLDTLVPKEVEVQTTAGEWYALRLQPYRTSSNVIEGAVITFMDITEIQKKREALRQANDQLRLAVVVHDAFDAITVQGLDGRIIAWNPGAERLYGWNEAEAMAMKASGRIPEALRAEELAKIYRLSLTRILEPYHTQRLTKGGELVEIWLIATALVNDAGKMYAVATTERAEALKIDPLTRTVI
ncbi:MAG: PAS domain-containing protein [Desulfobulbaceae bacterium]|nr:PAS domain-containing protein [Desulfobulbaceae bacterium]